MNARAEAAQRETLNARDITRELRTLWPVPVRLSTRDVGIKPGVRFQVRLPGGSATRWDCNWMDGYLTRHLGRPVTSGGYREVRRRDYGRDIELTLRVGRKTS